TRGSALSPCCMLRTIVCDSSSADDHSRAKASFTLPSPSGSRALGNAAAAPPSWPPACAMRSAMSRNRACCEAASSFPPRLHSSARVCMYWSGSTSEHHHLSHRLALVQAIEAEIDLVEPQPAAHQAVDRQPATAVELDIARQIADRHAGADIASLHG